MAGFTFVAVDDISVVDIAILNIQKEGRLLAERAAERAAEVPLQKRRFLRGVGIARIPDGVAEIGEDVAVQFVGARLGQDLDAPVAQLVVFGRKRILVDANLADGILATAACRR